MQNQEIATILKLTASLMELHDENVFKIKALQSAVLAIDKINVSLASLSAEELSNTEGLGKSISSKVYEICTTQSLAELSQLLSITPPGVIEMLDIKGIGPKKVRSIWKQLGIENTEDLIVACNDNKVAALKGFGEKTQESIRQFLLYKKSNTSKLLFAEAEILSDEILQRIKSLDEIEHISLSGEIRRKNEVVELIQIVAGAKDPVSLLQKIDNLDILEKNSVQSGPFVWRGSEKIKGLKVEIKAYEKEKFLSGLYIHSSSESHLKKDAGGKTIYAHALKTKASTEEGFLNDIGLPFIPPECREGQWEVEAAKEMRFPALLEYNDLKGILHNHTTYSDGVHTLEQMAIACKNLGYEYLGICDHSKSGNFYNGGMYENKVREQQKEIDELNIKLAPFKVFKGIESDILNDGSLDYDDGTLASFDFIVASIHSNLKMDEEKATARLLKAIENPYTTMLGHPSGRILLRREGYPLNYKKVIDACAANNVIIEINADPNRLDLDWRYVRYALDKGIPISINPDAHSMEAYENMKYGVYMGRKAGLTKEMTFNALSLSEIEEYFVNRKKNINGNG